MATGTRDVESELIESVCERVRERVAPEEAAEAEAFVRAYYRRAPADDLRGREPVDLYGAALDVAFIAWIRPEMNFGSVEELIRRMDEDSRLARHALARAPDAFPPIDLGPG